MNTSSIKPRDLIRLDVRGQRFIAEVTGRDAETGELLIVPILPSVTYRRARPRQVIEHWRRSKQSPELATAPVHTEEMF